MVVYKQKGSCGEGEKVSECFEGSRTVDLTDGLTMYMRRNGRVIEFPLARLADRHERGESLDSLANEIGISRPTLTKHLVEAGLLVKPEDRDTPLNRLVAQIPHDEVVERYEGGDSVQRIVTTLKKAGVPATVGAVEQVLDRRGVIRHSNPGEMPRGAPLGFSTSPQKDSDASEDKPRRTRLSRETLDQIAQEHQGGQGATIHELAARNGVGPDRLKRELRAAGHEVSTRSAWNARKLEELSDEIVRMYRREGLGTAIISAWLRQEYGVYASLSKLSEILRGRGVKLKPSKPVKYPAAPKKVKPAPVERANLLSAPRPRRPDRPPESVTQDPRWNAIRGREEELAKRILEGGEPVRKLAEELGVAHNWLATALKKTGHLPDVHLSRLRKQMRLREES